MTLEGTNLFVDYWWLFVVAGILLVALIFIMLFFFIGKKKNEKYERLIDERTNSVRIYVLYLNKNKVIYFNVASLRHIRECTLGEFYQKFPFADQKKVINWINAVADPMTKAPDYLETDMQEQRTRKQYFSMLQVEKVDYNEKVIHLQSYLLKYMATNKGDVSSQTHGLSNMKAVESAIRSNPSRGATVVFNFAYKKVADQDKEIEPLIFNHLKNVLFPFLEGKRYLMQCSGNELLLLDTRIDDHAKGLHLARSCLAEINRYLSLNGLSSSIDLRIGIVKHRDLQNEIEQIIETARRLAKEAYADKDIILWYEKDRKTRTYLEESSYRTEVERIINEKRLNYKFRPIIDVANGAVYGYLTMATPLDNYFDSLNDLKDYAMRTEDDRALFNTIAKETINRYASQCPEPDKLLFYPVRQTERGYMLITFSRLPKAKSLRLVITFDESDFIDMLSSNDVDIVLEDLRSIRAKGYELCLFLGTAQLRLPSLIYSAFDYFICSFASVGTAKEMDIKLRSQLHSLVEKLLKYEKPIIASDVDGWPSIELMVQSGLGYISSESIAGFDIMMNPVNPRNLKRIKDMKK